MAKLTIGTEDQSETLKLSRENTSSEEVVTCQTRSETSMYHVTMPSSAPSAMVGG